jgi:acetyl-CoA carboxylase carboxyl transferase subunit beta
MTAAPLVSTPAAPGTEADDWHACPGCRHLVYRPRLHRDLMVCPECRHHHRLSADERLAQLLDPGTFRPVRPQVTGTTRWASPTASRTRSA